MFYGTLVSTLLKEKASASADSELALDRVGGELQLIREVLDEIRTHFQWAVQNGRIGVRAERDDLLERLHAVAMFDEGDDVELELNDEMVTGEVVTVDDARNEATRHARQRSAARRKRRSRAMLT